MADIYRLHSHSAFIFPSEWTDWFGECNMPDVSVAAQTLNPNTKNL